MAQYDRGAFQVAAGSEVVLCFKNVSNTRPHNWVLVKAGTKDEVASRGFRGGPDNDYVMPEDSDVIAHTKLVDAGGLGEVRFTVPPTATYQFVCTVPGHAVSMFGTFMVTR